MSGGGRGAVGVGERAVLWDVVGRTMPLGAVNKAALYVHVKAELRGPAHARRRVGGFVGVETS